MAKRSKIIEVDVARDGSWFCRLKGGNGRARHVLRDVLGSHVERVPREGAARCSRSRLPIRPTGPREALGRSGRPLRRRTVRRSAVKVGAQIWHSLPGGKRGKFLGVVTSIGAVVVQYENAGVRGIATPAEIIS